MSIKVKAFVKVMFAIVTTQHYFHGQPKKLLCYGLLERDNTCTYPCELIVIECFKNHGG